MGYRQTVLPQYLREGLWRGVIQHNNITAQIERVGVTDSQREVLGVIDPRAPNIEDPGPELPTPHLVPFVLGEGPRDSSPNVVFISINMCLDRHWRDPMVGIGAPGLFDGESKLLQL